VKFRIRAVDSKGAEQTVAVDAADENAALKTAKANGLFPTSIEPVVSSPTASVPPRAPPVAAETGGHSDPVRRSIYEYKMVQVPPNIAVQQKHHKGSEAAAYLEKVVNKYARDGWEFHRVDSIGVDVLAGCLGVFVGQSKGVETYYVITFRRPA